MMRERWKRQLLNLFTMSIYQIKSVDETTFSRDAAPVSLETNLFKHNPKAGHIVIIELSNEQTT